MEEGFENREGNIESTGHAESFNDVLFPHLRRITLLASVEMRGGYYATVTSKTGTEKKVYISDTRENYSQAVLCLAHISIHKFDKKMKEYYKKFQKELKELKADFIKSSSVNERVILGEGFYRNPKDQVLLEEYRVMKLEMFQNLFEELNRLFGRKNWMEIGSATEED